jgi:hypothetical protein
VKGPGGLLEGLKPDMEQLRAAAEVRWVDYLSVTWRASCVPSLASV